MKNKFLLVVFSCLVAVSSLQAQDTYTVNGESLELAKAASGPVELLWNDDPTNYRYFIKKGDVITELKSENEAYKKVLQEATGADASEVKFNLISIRRFIGKENKAAGGSFNYEKKYKFTINAAIIAGLTNNPFVNNPNNFTTPFARAEFEFLDKENLPKHSIVLGLKQTFKSDKFDYSAFQSSLSYRYKFIHQKGFNVFANLNVVTFNSSSSNLPELDEDTNMLVTVKRDGSNFNAPLILGLGADIRIADNQYITVTILDLWGLNIDNNQQFPINLGVGYRFQL